MELSIKSYQHFLQFAEKQPFLTEAQEIQYFENLHALPCKKNVENIIYPHLRLVAKIAREYFHIYQDLLELSQQGVIGLMRALNNYKLPSSARFATYSLPWIHGEIKKFISGFIDNQTIDIESTTVSDDSYSDDSLEKQQQKNILSAAIKKLSPQEKHIIVSRYFRDEPVLREALAHEFGVSSERIRQIENKALKKLKENLDSMNISFMIE